MIRKQARQRRDYLYRKAQVLKSAEISEKRAKLRASIAQGRPLDSAIANDKALRKDFAYDEARPDHTVQEELDLDDEYHLSGLVEPRVLVTTSRDPSTRLAAFSKEVRLLLPTSIRLNRGNLILPVCWAAFQSPKTVADPAQDLVSSSQSAGLTDLVLLHEHRGTPTAMTISHFPHGPTASFSLHNVALRADMPSAVRGTVSEAYPHIICGKVRTNAEFAVSSVADAVYRGVYLTTRRPCVQDTKEHFPPTRSYHVKDEDVKPRHYL